MADKDNKQAPEVDVNALKAENKALIAALADAEKRLNEYKAQLASLTDEIEAVKKDLASEKAKVQEADEVNKQFEEQLREAHSALSEQEEETTGKTTVTIGKKDYRLTIPKGVMMIPDKDKGGKKRVEITAEWLRDKENKDHAARLVEMGYAGLVETKNE